MGSSSLRRVALTVMAVCVTGLALVVLVLAGYGWFVARDIEERFDGRKWRIPSRVYSDTTLLYPGQSISRDLLEERLTHLGYRPVKHAPRQPGRMRVKQDRIEVFLNGLRLPLRNRVGFPVAIGLGGKSIDSIHDMRTGDKVPILELEPEELWQFFGPEREERRLVSIEQIPMHVRQAVLAAEDARFYQHFGLDLHGIGRAMLANLRSLAVAQGGSTITQQLAKNYFLTPEKTLIRKLREMVIALVIETRYSKDQILEIYLNEIYFGQKGSVAVNGLGEAARYYFGTSVSELSLAQGAAIAGLIKAPNLYSPYVNLDRCERRRNDVLDHMRQEGWITARDHRQAREAGVDPFGYRSYGRKAPYFADYVTAQLHKLYPEPALSSLGLSIFTTLDTGVQRAAERALNRGLKRIEKDHPDLRGRPEGSRLQGAVVVMQPKTGSILALVGGRDYGISQFNRASHARRQPGSAFKPLVYLTGLNTFTPASLLSNQPLTYVGQDGEAWLPQNFSPVSEERLRLREALAQSVNRPAVDLAMRVGLKKVISTAADFGISTPMRPYPSLALGAFEVIPLELARAYCPFAADGMLPYPLSLKDVVDEEGHVLEGRHTTIRQVTSPARAYLMSSLLRSVVERGTASTLRGMGITRPVAGKTGTSDKYRDAWFVGYTPDILALVWVGADDGSPIWETGASAALPIWADLMGQIPEYLSGGWFRRPPGVVEKVICSQSGKLAVRGVCPQPLRELFLEGQTPEQACPLHRGRNVLERLYRGFHDALQ